MRNSTVRARGGLGVELEEVSVEHECMNQLVFSSNPTPIAFVVQVEDGESDVVLRELK